jgi:SAM-dependent methyltransferase
VPAMKVSPYPKLVAERYDITRKGPFPGELEYYLGCLDHADGAVLELALVPMAKRGINITGTDASPHMLAACERRCADEGIHPSLYQQTMQQLDLDQQFSMIFIADAFGLLIEDADVESMLERVNRHLEPGGVLAFDFDTPAIQPDDDHAGTQWWNWIEAEDGTVISSRSNQAVGDRGKGLWKEFRIDEKWADGRLIETEAWVSYGRHYTTEMVERFCAEAGFVEVRVTAHWDAGHVLEDGAQMALTCRKP